MDTMICNMAVCQCCMLSHANGECCADDEHGGDGIEPWAELEPGYSVTMGLLAEEHNENCTEEDREQGHCDCEDRGFSWSRCDGCGSTLGGNRWAFTLWKAVVADPIDDDARERTRVALLYQPVS